MRRAIGCAALAVLLTAACGPQSDLPAALTDQDFWRLFENLSEPGRSFDISENFVSNEPRLAENARWLSSSGGVYIGVGPEQNLTYVARMRPRMAFVIDIRRENADLHFLYKALFDLSADRVELVSRLFSRPVPDGLSRSASVDTIFDHFDRVAPSPARLAETKRLVRERLLTAHALPLQQHDLDAIDRALQAFHDGGPAIHFWGSQTVDRDTVRPSYRRLMTMPDLTGQARSYLSDESGFRFLKEMHRNNLIIPVVGDFGGNDAIRRVGAYVREHHDAVRAFYGSNVAVYLTNQQMRTFCANLAALPVSRSASFVESDSVITFAAKLQGCGGRQAASGK